jgi:hypothetical protein
VTSRWLCAACAAVLTALAVPPAELCAQTEIIDYQTIARIREEGLQRSQAMEHLIWLADVYGPRVSGTPGMEQAGEWAMKRMRDWGLANVHLERFPFGRGWNTIRFSANLIEPQPQPIIGLPKNFSTSTNGLVTAEVVLAPIGTQADLDKWRGKLRGKIVLTQPARAVRMLDQAPIVLRMGEKDIAEAQAAAISQPQRGGGGAGRAGGAGRGAGGGAGAGTATVISAQQAQEFYASEGAVALLERGSENDVPAGGSDLSWVTQRVDGGTIFPGSAGSRSTEPRGLPQATLAVEHYNRMVRILERGVPVRMELEIKTQFHEESATTPNGFNVMAEIPGTDARLKDQVVMLGAHFDGVPAATGATDNATGSAAMMEALRILQTVGVRPRRTIRIGLWGGEEHGLLGSRAYAREHFGEPTGTQRKPEHAKFSAYFNIDNGTGRIRGVWLQDNFLVRPIFAQWIEPLKDLGVEILGPRSVSGTDHLAFDAVGLPGFQFVQERLEYNSRTHHSNMDFVDRVQRDDLVQMATVAAVFAFLAAQRDELLPRKPAQRPASN